jgi:putative effector of murein hydrolase
VVAAFTAVANSLAGMITAESIASAVAVGAAVIRSAVTTACAATVATAVPAAISTAAAITATATISTATATAIFRIGRIHGGQISREKWGGCEHHGAGHDSNETLVF